MPSRIALRHARAVAGDRDIRIAGGADVRQQYLRAGLVDELALAISPVIFGGGPRLFAGVGRDVGVELVETIASPRVTHVRYAVQDDPAPRPRVATTIIRTHARQGGVDRGQAAARRYADRMTHDRAYWEQLWARTLREHPDKVARRPPSAYLTAEAASLGAGRALDAGCGHGAETLWLAAHGWEVTAVDFSPSALAHARSTAEAMGPEIAARIAWVEGDLAVWTPPRDHFDLVACLYVHVAGSVEDMVRRMAGGVAPGGTLFMLGHRPIDPATGKATAAASQVQVSVESAVAVLEPAAWTLVVAEERPRAVAGTGVDAVIVARRAT